MFRVGIIGAGYIAKKHIGAFQALPECEVAVIADINREAAEKLAEEFGVKGVCTDYHDILNDASIDAITIGTPTFTHKEIAIEAIRCNKHVFCEKPVAMNADEVRAIKAALEASSKVFMFGMVRRHSSEIACLKQYIDSGKMGQIICAEVVRVNAMQDQKGWFAKRSLGGGVLKDEAIHHIDELLYLMGYPKVKMVSAFESRINNDLPFKIKAASDPALAGSTPPPKDVEDVIKAFVTLDNGANLTIKTSSVLLTKKTGVYSEINGQKAGAITAPWGMEHKLEIMEVTEDNCLREFAPELPDVNAMNAQMAHFVDCCQNGTECITKIDEAITLTQLLDAIYESAAAGETVIVNP